MATAGSSGSRKRTPTLQLIRVAKTKTPSTRKITILNVS
jgi:hypothetical protein